MKGCEIGLNTPNFLVKTFRSKVVIQVGEGVVGYKIRGTTEGDSGPSSVAQRPFGVASN